MEELSIVEKYLLRGKYPEGLSKGEKANLRRKCRNNFKLDQGILYYKKNVSGDTDSWKICARTEEEKKRIWNPAMLGLEVC